MQKADKINHASLLCLHMMAGRTWRPAQYRGAGGCSERRLRRGCCIWRLIVVSMLFMCLARMHVSRRVTCPKKPNRRNIA